MMPVSTLATLLETNEARILADWAASLEHAQLHAPAAIVAAQINGPVRALLRRLGELAAGQRVVAGDGAGSEAVGSVRDLATAFASHFDAGLDVPRAVLALKQPLLAMMPRENRGGADRLAGEIVAASGIIDRIAMDVAEAAVRRPAPAHALGPAERRLRQTEERLAAALRAGKLGVHDFDPRTGVIDWDQRTRELWGLSPDETVTFEAFLGGLHPDDRARVQAAVDQALDASGPRRYQAEYRVVNRRDGRTRWVYADGDISFEGDTPARLVGTVQDITARKEAEAALKDRDDTLRLALNAAYAIAFTWDIEADEVQRLHSSEPVLAATDGRPERFSDVKRVVHPEDLARFEAAVASALDDPAGAYRNEYRLVRPGGEVRWLSERGQVERSAGGKPIRIVGISIDITERKQSEEDLRAARSRLQNAVEVAGLSVYEWDPATGKRNWDERLRAMWGLPADAHVDYDVFLRGLHPDDTAMVKAAVARSLDPAGDGLYAAEFRVIGIGDGRQRWVSARGRTRFRDGVPVGFVGAALDITERKRAEEHIRMLLAEVNHRSKNLLAVVQSIARQTARDSAPADFAANLTERIQGLSASQDLIIRGDWHGVVLADLVHSQLSHLGEPLRQRVRLAGPRIVITPPAAQGIGMALHELASNAMRFGSLSGPTGQVVVAWGVSADARGPRFTIGWAEQDGPLVCAPTRSGFGRMVIERIAAHAVGGEVELSYASGGVRWQLTAPATEVIASDAPASPPGSRSARA